MGQDNKSSDIPSIQAFSLKVECYQSFLDDADIPEDQKQALIDALWLIVLSIVDFKLGLHSKTCSRKDTQTSIRTLIAGMKQKDSNGTITRDKEIV